ncbi:MAG: hypothetical protein C4516_06920 [Oxalobacter sp.]|nr:MAG: hypothetical protein C4516_06920 [Oxalobacter sp.]
MTRKIQPLITLVIFLFAKPCFGKPAAQPPTPRAGVEVRTSMSDVFKIPETDQWNVKVERQLTLRFADVRVDDKKGYKFSLMLYFKADTPDIAQFDTPSQMKAAVRRSSEKYLPSTVEKSIVLHLVPVYTTYGYYTVLTDAKVVNRGSAHERDFKHITRGMLRVSKDTALGFSLMTNDVDSAEYMNLMNYIYGFVKAGSK